MTALVLLDYAPELIFALTSAPVAVMAGMLKEDLLDQ